MIISTKKGAPKEELEKIVDKFEKQGLDVTLITGKDYNVFGLVGDTTKIDERDVLANPWIDNVTRVSAPYKRANRLFHPADSVIDCGGVKIGSKEKIAVMAGPCSIEGEEQALRIAKNSAEFLPKAEAALGHPIEIIAGREEARLVFAGCAHTLPPSPEKRLVVDIGGASTELIIGSGTEAHCCESFHVGCVNTSVTFF